MLLTNLSKEKKQFSPLFFENYIFTAVNFYGLYIIRSDGKIISHPVKPIYVSPKGFFVTSSRAKYRFFRFRIENEGIEYLFEMPCIFNKKKIIKVLFDGSYVIFEDSSRISYLFKAGENDSEVCYSGVLHFNKYNLRSFLREETSGYVVFNNGENTFRYEMSFPTFISPSKYIVGGKIVKFRNDSTDKNGDSLTSKNMDPDRDKNTETEPEIERKIKVVELSRYKFSISDFDGNSLVKIIFRNIHYRTFFFDISSEFILFSCVSKEACYLFDVSGYLILKKIEKVSKIVDDEFGSSLLVVLHNHLSKMCERNKQKLVYFLENT